MTRLPPSRMRTLTSSVLTAMLSIAIAGCGGGGGTTADSGGVEAPGSSAKTLLSASTYASAESPLATVTVGDKGSIDMYRNAADATASQVHITSPGGEFAVTENTSTGSIVVRDVKNMNSLSIERVSANRINATFYDASGNFQGGFALYAENDKVYVGAIEGAPLYSGTLVITTSDSSTVLQPAVDAGVTGARELTAQDLSGAGVVAQASPLLDIFMSPAFAADPAWWTALTETANTGGRARFVASLVRSGAAKVPAGSGALVSAASTAVSVCAAFACSDATAGASARWAAVKADLESKWQSVFDAGNLFGLGATNTVTAAGDVQQKTQAPSFAATWTSPVWAALPVKVSTISGSKADSLGAVVPVRGTLSAAGTLELTGTGTAISGQFNATEKTFAGTVNGATATGAPPSSTLPDVKTIWKNQNVNYQPVTFSAEVSTLTASSSLTNTVFKPAGNGPFPAVVLLHTCGGVNSPHFRERIADLLAAGYVVLSLDSYTPRGVEHCRRSDKTPPKSTSVLDAYAALDHLSKLSIVDPSHIYQAGYSHGGLVAAMLSSPQSAEAFGSRLRFRATVANYASCTFQTSPTQAVGGTLNLIRDADRPLLMLMASEDMETKPSTCFPLIRTLKAAGRDVDWHIYNGAYHAWDHSDLPPNYSITTGLGETAYYKYDATVTADATKRMLAFFEKHK